MRLSIIIPVYQVERYVGKTLASCVHQQASSVEYEIIVVNDGTPDRSMDIVHEYAMKYPHIVVINQANQGLSAARNAGILAASGEYVWFVDSDDWVDERALFVLSDYLDGYNDEIVFSGKNIDEAGNQILSVRNVFQNHHAKCYSGAECWMINIQQVSASVFAVYRKNFLLEKKLFFKKGYFNEDIEFCPKASYLSRRTVYLKDCLYYVRQNPHSISRTVNPKIAFDDISLCHFLYEFCETQVVEPVVKRKMHSLISMDINEALRQIVICKQEEIEEFELFCKKQKNPIFSSLLKSRRPKYMLEWALFLFTCKYASVYKFLVGFKVKKASV